MNFPKVRTDTRTAFLLYHSLPYFTTKDVEKLFGCKKTTAYRIKQLIKEKMKEEEKKVYTDRDVLDKDVLYREAGLNIKQIDRDYRELRKYE